MRRHHIDVRVSTTADPGAVYALLRDGESWPTWSPIGSFELEQPGKEDKEGVGAVRVFRTGRVASREQIVELVPGRRFSYALLSGLAIRNYRADIDLDAAESSTTVHWHSSFSSKVPGLGGVYRRTLQRFIQRAAEGLAAHAEQAEHAEQAAGPGGA